MSHAPTAALERRHQIVRADLAARGLDALVVTSLPNVLYLTNFTGSAGVAVVTRDRVYFVTDFRYVTAMGEQAGTAHDCPGLEMVVVEGSYDAKLANLIRTKRWSRVGIEAAHLTVGRFQWLVATLASAAGSDAEPGHRSDLVATEEIVERARVRKDSYEIATLREAARRLSRVADAVFGEVRTDRSEHEVASAIDALIREEGFARSAFDTIVAAGPHAARPHHHPGERKLTEGDLVVLDFGGVYDSYCVDLTRTVSVGTADRRARDVYAAVRDAHDHAIQAVEPGRSRFDIDAAAREVLAARGFAEAFGHGTGHGLGIEVHEHPRITRRRPDVAAEDEAIADGMVFTIEPGVYLPGWGGVRIEDDVLVTATGVDVLTDVPTDLIEL